MQALEPQPLALARLRLPQQRRALLLALLLAGQRPGQRTPPPRRAPAALRTVQWAAGCPEGCPQGQLQAQRPGRPVRWPPPAPAQG